MLKRLLEETPARGRRPRRSPRLRPPQPSARASRAPAMIRWRQSSARATRLNGKGSEKDTRHVVFDISGSGLTYTPGDSFGLYPKNDPALAEAVRAALGVPPISRSAASPSATP